MLDHLQHSLKNRPDSEHEQAFIRLAVALVVSLYTFSALWFTYGTISSAILLLVAGFFIVAITIVVWIVLDPGMNRARRILGAVIDNFGATTMLYLNGDLAAPVFIVYLWVAFGNGFRFGRKYLLFSTILAISGFSFVLLFSDLWQIGHSLNIGLLVGLIALPLYVSSLLGRLEKALHGAEAANRAKSNFLATMSHEIRTPLNGLIGMLELLDTTALPDQQKHYIELMKNSSDWLLNVLSDGLDFTKIEAGELVLAPQPIDIHKLVEELSAVHGEIAKKSGLTFTAEYSGLPRNPVICDKNRLTQVLNNLLNNACKFTKEGHISFTVTSSRQGDDSSVIRVVVKDTGVGIPPEELGEIFTPFKQLQPAKDSVHTGSGLGLAISSRLVTLMGGELTVESSPGEGTSFSLTLPVTLAPLATPETQTVSPAKISWQRVPRVLLVEDNEVNREVATAYLTQLGCTVVSAENGQQAVETCTTNPFDLIFMDCQMPVMDGYTATRQIRSEEKSNERHVIVALTAHITAQDRAMCFDAGMDDYMGKPFKVDTLSGMLNKWLSHLHNTSPDSNQESETPESPEATGSIPSHYDRGTIHDLRNMLSGVIGAVELAILSQDSPESSREYMKKALGSARQAVKLSRRL